jgi:catechol 2,3-dioxygenase-like lactoylglutathione lyase family enzyme
VKFALDHVVIAVGDLEQAIADYRSLGFTVVPGGRHPGRTSHNALIVFEDGAYIELIAWTAPNDAERWNVVHRAHGDGFMDFALIPNDLTRATAEAKARGLPLNGPIDGGRVRPDGVELKWQTARQTTFDLPFFCADVTPRSLRVPEGDVRRHANGAIGVATVVVAVKDLDASASRYRAMLGDAVPGTAKVDLTATEVRSAMFMLANGTTLALAAVAGAPSSPLAQVVDERMRGQGEGPCAMSIRSQGAACGALNVQATHLAYIELVN